MSKHATLDKIRSLPYDEALELWQSLRDTFINAEATIVKIVKDKAWEPLGYATFPEAWAATMDGVKLATEIRSHVVYAMFDAGLTAQEVGDQLLGTGMGPSTIEDLKRQKDAGVPAGIVVRRHLRKPACATRTVHVELSPTQHRLYTRAAVNQGHSLSDVAREQLANWYAERVDA